MNDLLVKFLVLASIVQLGIEAERLISVRGIENVATLNRLQKIVTKVNWQPISVFPEQAKRFQ